jgi:hypothetical protein
VAPAVRGAEDLARRDDVLGRRAGRALLRRVLGERRVLEDEEVVDVLHVVVRAEAERVDLALGRRVDPAALVARERPLLVVARDDVLAQLGADALDQVPPVADEREVAQDRVAALQRVARGDRSQRGADRTADALALTHGDRLPTIPVGMHHRRLRGSGPACRRA